MKKLLHHQLSLTSDTVDLRQSFGISNTESFASHPPFQGWIEELTKPNNRRKLRKLIRTLVLSGEVKTWEQGVDYLYDHVSRNHSPNKVHLNASDIKKSNGISVSKLNKSLGEKQDFFEFTRAFGVFLHGRLENIWSGRCFENSGETLLFKQPPVTFGSSFKFVEEKQLLLDNLNDDYLYELSKCWSKLADKLGKTDWLIKSIPLNFKELKWLLGPFITEESTNALKNRGRENFPHFSAFYNLALMSLASAVIHVGRVGHCCGLCEIPIISRCYDLGGWRIDMLVVKSIEGKPPTAKAIQTVNKIQKLTFSSVPQILSELRRAFGYVDMTLSIRDFKFSLGDAVASNEFISPDEVDVRPVPEHERQLKTYLALANFSEALCKRKGDPWKNGITFTEGELVYVFPNKPPVIYPVEVEAEAQRTVFHQNISWKINRAKTRAMIRSITNMVMDKIIVVAPKIPDSLVNGVNGNGHHKNGNGKSHHIETSTQEVLIDVPRAKVATSHFHEHALELIESSRVYLDDLHLIEQLEDKKGVVRNWVHLDRFLKAVEEKKIKMRYFNPKSGGLISCIMPHHADPGPSMYVYLNEGSFHCYGCGAHLMLHPDSIPPEFKLNYREGIKGQIMRNNNLNDYSFKNLVIPPEHFEVMGWLQVFLRKAFEGSPAWDYVKNDRKIDPEIAQHFGAGFFSASVAREMLHMLGFDGLVHYGLISFSSLISIGQSLLPFLRRRGMKDEYVTRTVEGINGKSRIMLPYFVLKDYVTFPLSFEGNKVTSIYGRALYDVPKEEMHVKLSKRHTGVPPGMFDSDVLETNPSEVVLVEGPFDKLTLFQSGLAKNVVGNVGTLNRYILTEIVRRKISLGAGYDNDEGGRIATLNTQRFVCQAGGEDYPFHDFTTEFLAQHPEAMDYDDYNSWWKDIGYKIYS